MEQHQGGGRPSPKPGTDRKSVPGFCPFEAFAGESPLSESPCFPRKTGYPQAIQHASWHYGTEGLPRLKKLELRRIDIPATDVETLRAALPSVAIDWKPLTDDERTKLEAFLK